MIAFVAFLVAAVQTPKHAPRWFDNMLAGYAFAYDEKHGQAGVYDPKTHWMIVRSIECDGADLTLLLTRDRNLISGIGYDVPKFKPKNGAGGMAIKVKAIPTLKTGKGVSVGDTPTALARRLGKPSRIERSGGRNQFRDHIYKYKDGETTYEQTYTFKAGKLIEIRFSRFPSDQ